MPIPSRWAALLLLAAGPATCPAADGPTRFERVVIDADFPGGYQVEVADVNGDGRPDLVGVGGGTCAWYENPAWTRRAISTPKDTPDIISSATLDLDGDGKAEVAIAYDFAMNTPTRGKLTLATQGANLGDPWTFRPVVDDRQPDPAGALPSIHRLRWARGISPGPRRGQVANEKMPSLVVAPIFGAAARAPAFGQAPARIVGFDPGPDPLSGRWSRFSIGEAPVVHAFAVESLGGLLTPQVLAASNRGVTAFRPRPTGMNGGPYTEQDLAPGAPGEAPKKGASEVHLGKLRDGRRFLATVEPWHGTDVAVYFAEADRPGKFGPRTVIDATLKEGHALWVADVDGDGDDEVFAGDRGAPGGVTMYDLERGAWVRTLIDPAITAQDLRGGDLDGDGTPDVVAIGGRTHNVVWYRPIRGK